MNRHEKKLHNFWKIVYKFSYKKIVEQKNQGIFNTYNQLNNNWLHFVHVHLAFCGPFLTFYFTLIPSPRSCIW